MGSTGPANHGELVDGESLGDRVLDGRACHTQAGGQRLHDSFFEEGRIQHERWLNAGRQLLIYTERDAPPAIVTVTAFAAEPSSGDLVSTL